MGLSNAWFTAKALRSEACSIFRWRFNAVLFYSEGHAGGLA